MNGRLSLRFERTQDCSCTIVRLLEQQPPWRVVRGFRTEAGASLVHLNNISGGILAGDRLDLQIQLSAGASAQVTTAGATRVYRGRPGLGAAVSSTAISLAENSLLEFLPDPLIPFADSWFEQRTSIHLAGGASLFWWEVIAPGRDAAGEVHKYRCLRLSSEIFAEGQPIAMERIQLDPALRPLESAARLGRYRYLVTFFICKVGHSSRYWRELEQELAGIVSRLTQPDEVRWAVSTLTRHGIIIRGMCREGRSAWPALHEFWRVAKHHLVGQAAVLPRKIY